jgi:hypothetical protein
MKLPARVISKNLQSQSLDLEELTLVAPHEREAQGKIGRGNPEVVWGSFRPMFR